MDEQIFDTLSELNLYLKEEPGNLFYNIANKIISNTNDDNVLKLEGELTVGYYIITSLEKDIVITLSSDNIKENISLAISYFEMVEDFEMCIKLNKIII